MAICQFAGGHSCESSHPERAESVFDASLQRESREADKREKLRAGELSYDLDGLRARVEGER